MYFKVFSNYKELICNLQPKFGQFDNTKIKIGLYFKPRKY